MPPQRHTNPNGDGDARYLRVATLISPSLSADTHNATRWRHKHNAVYWTFETDFIFFSAFLLLFFRILSLLPSQMCRSRAVLRWQPNPTHKTLPPPIRSRVNYEWSNQKASLHFSLRFCCTRKLFYCEQVHLCGFATARRCHRFAPQLPMPLFDCHSLFLSLRRSPSATLRVHKLHERTLRAPSVQFIFGMS